MGKIERRIAPNAKGEVGPLTITSGDFYRVIVGRVYRFRLVDDNGKGVAGERYVVRFSDGTQRSGALDEAGRGSEGYILGAEAALQFPDLRPDVWGQLGASAVHEVMCARSPG